MSKVGNRFLRRCAAADQTHPLTFAPWSVASAATAVALGGRAVVENGGSRGRLSK